MENAVATTLRRMIRQRIPKESIPSQSSTALKTMAAVAHIVLHGNRYLDERNRLRTSYGALLAELTGHSMYETSALVGASKKLGLHVAHKSPKGDPYIPGTYWSVEIVIPQKRKTMLHADVVTIVRQAYNGEVAKKQIPALATTPEQVAAAVGYILRHGSTYIDVEGRVVRPYPALLAEITKRPESDHNTLRQSSLLHGLHRLAPSMPGKALPGVRKPVILTTLTELERRLAAVPMLSADRSMPKAANDPFEGELSTTETALQIAERGLEAVRAEGGEVAVDMLYILLRGRRL